MIMTNGVDEDEDSIWVKLSATTCFRKAIADELYANPVSSLVDLEDCESDEEEPKPLLLDKFSRRDGDGYLEVDQRYRKENEDL